MPMPVPMRFDRAARGFTLLELLVVLVIAGAAVALAVPRFAGGVASVEIKGAARDIASALRYARGQAIAQRSETLFTLDLEQREYAVPGVAKTYRLPQNIDLKLTTARSEMLNENVGGIRFFPDGTGTGGRVTLERGERRMTVDVDWLTGRVAIHAD